MKNTFFYIAILSLLFNYSCNFYLEQQPTSNDDIVISNETITIVPSPNDLQTTGVICNPEFKTGSPFFSDLLEEIEIPDSLAPKIDLSKNMPPVRSQGKQGSCVAWAIGYYLKSYQEKIQYGYEYESFEDVMSPAFLYNHVKVEGDCSIGSSIPKSLELLQEVGITSWKDFPYSEDQCDKIPDDELIAKAQEYKIGEYGVIPTYYEHENPNYTLKNILKALLLQEIPIIMCLDIKNIEFEITEENLDNESFHIVTNYNFIKESCGHALLIVGYDDEIQAFKFINSWGSDWKNDGYAWIHYNFFLEPSNTDYEKGINSLYIAYDEEDTETSSL